MITKSNLLLHQGMPEAHRPPKLHPPKAKQLLHPKAHKVAGDGAIEAPHYLHMLKCCVIILGC